MTIRTLIVDDEAHARAHRPPWQPLRSAICFPAPTGLRLRAQGCRAAATLGLDEQTPATPTELWPSQTLPHRHNPVGDLCKSPSCGRSAEHCSASLLVFSRGAMLRAPQVATFAEISVGVAPTSARQPKVAAQPWAGGRNPFGIPSPAGNHEAHARLRTPRSQAPQVAVMSATETSQAGLPPFAAVAGMAKCC